jgi:hypothetical protein
MTVPFQRFASVSAECGSSGQILSAFWAPARTRRQPSLRKTSGAAGSHCRQKPGDAELWEQFGAAAARLGAATSSLDHSELADALDAFAVAAQALAASVRSA